MKGWLDRLPPALRHLLLMLAAAGLSWAGSDLVPALRDQGGLWAAVAAPVLVLGVAAATKWTTQYGRGSERVDQAQP